METTATTSVETFSAAIFNHIVALGKQKGVNVSLDRDIDVNNMPKEAITALFAVNDMLTNDKLTYHKICKDGHDNYTVMQCFRIRNITINEHMGHYYLWMRGRMRFLDGMQVEASDTHVKCLLSLPHNRKGAIHETREWLDDAKPEQDTYSIVVEPESDANE